MNWDDLRVFLAVARRESLSAAARGLRIDPATVSRRIARLEEETGAALFAKSPQGYAIRFRKPWGLWIHFLRPSGPMGCLEGPGPPGHLKSL